MTTQIRQEATVLAVREFVQKHGKDGKLTLCIKPKKDWKGQWWLHFRLRAGETVVADLEKMRLSKHDEMQLSDFYMDFTDLH